MRRDLRVLVVGTNDLLTEQAAEILANNGCEVLRCHKPGASPFICNALLDGVSCPLDIGFEVVVTARHESSDQLGPGEFGVVCAHHVDVPVVVWGTRDDAVMTDTSATTASTATEARFGRDKGTVTGVCRASATECVRPDFSLSAILALDLGASCLDNELELLAAAPWD